MRRCVAIVALLAVATPAAAQSTYVGASLVGDVARFSKVDYDDDDGRPRILTGEVSADGEALGFNIKVGRAITDRWGIEFEYARSGVFENTYTEILPADTVVPGFGPGGVVGSIVAIPYFDYEAESERQHMSVSALLFVRHELGDRVELSYSGGVAFNRIETEHDFRVDTRRLAIYPPIFSGLETIEYNVGPAVGAEAAFKFGDSAALTGGIRLHGVDISGRGGWLIRPNVGMRWTF